MTNERNTQGHAEDILLMQQYRYFVLGDKTANPMVTAVSVARRWSVSIASVPASTRAEDYPAYVVEGRRPSQVERMRRDWAIVDRWLDAL